MTIRTFGCIIFTILISLGLTAQDLPRHFFTGSDGTRVYLPLGTRSFADSIIKFRLGYPRPKTRFRDSTEALHQPNYKDYSSPDFVSLGCKGQITLAFTDNGFMNLPGPDITIFEVGPAKERTRVEVSEDGRSWKYAGDAGGATSEIDLADKGFDSTTVYKYVRLMDLKDECTGKSAGADVDAVAANNSVIILNVTADVLFDVDKYNLKETATPLLDTLTAKLREIGKATVRIEGHTDNDADERYNLKLSEKRCRAVEKRLRLLLRNTGRFDFELLPYGESKPKVPNESPENKQINRRVEILVLPPRDYHRSFRKD